MVGLKGEGGTINYWANALMLKYPRIFYELYSLLEFMGSIDQEPFFYHLA